VVSFLSPFFFSRLPQCLHDNLFAFDARTYKNGERISSSFSALSWLKLLSFFFLQHLGSAGVSQIRTLAPASWL